MLTILVSRVDGTGPQAIFRVCDCLLPLISSPVRDPGILMAVLKTSAEQCLHLGRENLIRDGPWGGVTGMFWP